MQSVVSADYLCICGYHIHGLWKSSVDERPYIGIVLSNIAIHIKFTPIHFGIAYNSILISIRVRFIDMNWWNCNKNHIISDVIAMTINYVT